MDKVRKTLQDRAAELDIGLNTLSLKAGRNHAYLQQFIQRGTPRRLPEDVRRIVAAELGLDETELGAASPAPEIRYVPVDDELTQQEMRTAIEHSRRSLKPGEVLEIDVRAGLGGGGFEPEILLEDGQSVEGVRAKWQLPVDFLHSELRAKEIDLDIIRVDGDSMLPTLTPGDRVFVDRSHVRPSPDGTYAIFDGIGVVVKRLEVIQGSSPPRIRVKSDNPAHSSYEQDAEEIRVIGRVVCRVTRL